ncbi:P-loop NTPase fold protein [Ruminobacter sp. RM87]|uniref:KAP family P-loop NTPase fold protein n=1 Tax=Ruminobacter sp. RM87 TaxID=1200567 RepID=UPI0004E18401|nr:P-loop NTPase fold protein [Ruminobacter sp. RM87]
MKYTNIIDSPLGGTEKDLLGVSDYVNALSRFLSSASMPTTIAIQGEWGSGKTSFMNQIKSQLCDDADKPDTDKMFHGIWVNMWEYSMMKDPEDILINVIKGLTSSCLEVFENRVEKNSFDVENLKKKTWGFIKATSAFAVKAVAHVGLNAVGADGENLIEDYVDSIKGEKKDALTLKEVRPKEFRDAFAKVITECLDLDRKNGDTNKKGFMFFIDDLDRIPPENAVHILELLKNLFEVENCIFVLAIDYEVVVKGLKAKFGAENQMDERAYRSFFDKIIQMPFSMPIGAYDITGFVESSVDNIGVFTHDELNQLLSVDGEKVKTSEVLADMVLLSTGTNPRSIKRLLNSLSLIDIMHKIKIQKERECGRKISDMSVEDKAMNFGLVCIQVAYPDIYDLLIQESNFLEWDDSSARDFRLKALTPEKAEYLGTLEEFDEKWEQVLYRACQKSIYLSNRVLNISRLLNKIRFLCPDQEQFPAKIVELLGMSAVTTVSSVDSVTVEANKNKNYSRSNDVEDFFSKVKCRNPDLIKRLRWLIGMITEIFGNTVKPAISTSQLAFWFTSPVSRNRRFLAIWCIPATKEDPNEYIEIAPCAGGSTVWTVGHLQLESKRGFVGKNADWYKDINFRIKWAPGSDKEEILGFHPYEYVSRKIWTEELWNLISDRYTPDKLCDSYNELFMFITECFFKYGSKAPLPKPFTGITEN